MLAGYKEDSVLALLETSWGEKDRVCSVGESCHIQGTWCQASLGTGRSALLWGRGENAERAAGVANMHDGGDGRMFFRELGFKLRPEGSEGTRRGPVAGSW